MTTINLTWTPAGGPTSTSQDVQYKLASSPTWLLYENVGPAVATKAISGLTDNMIYQARVLNNCSLGGPAPSTAFEGIKFTCPSLTLTPDFESVEVSFSELGGDVDEYDIKLYAADGTTLLATINVPTPGPTVTETFTGLTAGTTYKVRVIPKATSSTPLTFSKTDCALVSVDTGAAPSCGLPTGVSATIV